MTSLASMVNDFGKGDLIPCASQRAKHLVAVTREGRAVGNPEKTPVRFPPSMATIRLLIVRQGAERPALLAHME